MRMAKIEVGSREWVPAVTDLNSVVWRNVKAFGIRINKAAEYCKWA